MRTLLILALLATPAAAQNLRDTKPLDPPVFTKPKAGDPPGIHPVPGLRVPPVELEARRPPPPPVVGYGRPPPAANTYRNRPPLTGAEENLPDEDTDAD